MSTSSTQAVVHAARIIKSCNNYIDSAERAIEQELNKIATRLAQPSWLYTVTDGWLGQFPLFDREALELARSSDEYDWFKSSYYLSIRHAKQLLKLANACMSDIQLGIDDVWILDWEKTVE